MKEKQGHDWKVTTIHKEIFFYHNDKTALLIIAFEYS